MAWDTESTRRKLQDAATAHFAAVGLAGARVDAIARDAGVNKERIYQYFGDKAGLFEAVLATEVERLLAGIAISGAGADAVADLAGHLCDRASAFPELTRLLLWESLELSEPISAESRAAGCAAMVRSLADALPDHDRTRASQLLLSVVALALADQTLPHLAALIAPGSSPRERRASAIAQARALAIG